MDDSTSESSWVVRHRELVAILEDVASTPGIETLVLFGSFARGEERDGSDVDLVADGPLVRDFAARRRVTAELSERLDRAVELNALDLLQRSPSVLLGAIDDGRVVTDRRRRWAAMQERRPEIEIAASAEHAAHRGRRAAALKRIGEIG